jgi:hypothetical protein
MHSPVEIILALLAVALGTALVAAVRPIPEVAFVLQCSGVGGLVGAAVGVARRSDEAGMIARFTAVGSLTSGTAGLLVVGVEALVL